MLTKAILTGGVLSVLAGSIVYFGTEGADALDRETREDARVESNELAGAPVSEGEAEIAETVVKTPKKQKKKKKKRKSDEAQAQSEVISEAEVEKNKIFEPVTEFETVAETVVVQPTPTDWPAENLPEELESGVDVLAQTSPVQIPPVEGGQDTKPKTRWLDQYLKSDKNKAKASEPKSEVTDVVIEKSHEAEIEAEVEVVVEGETGKKMMATMEEGTDPQATQKVKKKMIVKMDGDKKMVWSSDDESQMDEDIDMEMIEMFLGEHTDMDMEMLKDAKKEIRIIKLDGKKHKGSAHHSSLKAIDYDAVLVEAKKLQVIDMRNEAFLEIVDYAVDRGDIGDAADIVDELSSPELRDTARARIGVGLATRGDMEAAFAVIDEVEIDELAAPIRLEIIAALMATRAERAARREIR